VERFRNLALAVLLPVLAVAPAGAGAAGRLPGPLAADCGSGTSGIGFTAYSCIGGGAGTRYAHSAELLVVRSSGAYTGFQDSISEPNLMVRSTAGEVVAAHNDSIVRVTDTGLKPLVSKRQLVRLLPGSPGVAAIDRLAVTASGAVFFRANDYAPHDRGCANIRAEQVSGGYVRVLQRSAVGLTCG
jgi:hypothetical protein